jgi:hypothetical protein
VGAWVGLGDLALVGEAECDVAAELPLQATSASKTGRARKAATPRVFIDLSKNAIAPWGCQ